MSKKDKHRDTDSIGKLELEAQSTDAPTPLVNDPEALRDAAIDLMRRAVRALPQEGQLDLLIQTRFLVTSTPGTDSLKVLEALLRDAAELTGLVGTDFEREDDWQPAMRLTTVRRYLLRALCAARRADFQREQSR